MDRQYVGARYVPKFFDWNGSAEWRTGVAYEALTIVTFNNASYTSKVPVPPTVGDPADNPDYWALTGNAPKFFDWNGSAEWRTGVAYEALTIVTFNNASYTSKVPVPPTVGDPADNPDYWALTGNYNAQVEQYRQETQSYNAQVEQYRQETQSYKTQVEAYRKETASLSDNIKILSTNFDNINYVNIKDFGCVGDGSTDDTENLQNAINTAKNTNKQIYVPNGTYLISGDIELPHPVNLYGQSHLSKIISNSINYIKITGSSQEYGDGITIANLYFTRVGFKLGETTDDYGCFTKFINVIFFGANKSYNAITLKNNSWNVLFAFCEFANLANGISFSFLDGTTKVINSGACIKIIGCDLFNNFNGIALNGAAIDGASIMIVDCDIEHNSNAINITNGGGANFYLTNIHFETNSVSNITNDGANVYVNNVWDAATENGNFIAHYICSSGRIFINSGTIFNRTGNTLLKVTGGTILINPSEITSVPIIKNGNITTTDSTGTIKYTSYEYESNYNVQYEADKARTILSRTYGDQAYRKYVGVFEISTTNDQWMHIYLRNVGSDFPISNHGGGYMTLEIEWFEGYAIYKMIYDASDGTHTKFGRLVLDDANKNYITVSFTSADPSAVYPVIICEHKYV